MRVCVVGVVIVVMIVMARAVLLSGQGRSNDARVAQTTPLDVGGTSSEPIADVLSGNVLSIPLRDPIVLDAQVETEANIAQQTTSVAISEDALETTLAAVSETRGSGVATSDFVDGRFQHVIVATLPDPSEGFFYEGWLIRSKPFDFFSTGALIQHADDLKWYLVWESDRDARDFNKVIVTLEPDDGNQAPDIHILEGRLEIGS